MLYIISEIVKSLFIDNQVRLLTCAFHTPSKERIKEMESQVPVDLVTSE